MYNNDYILRIIEDLCTSLANTIFQKDVNIFEIVDPRGNISESGFLHHRLKKMIYDRKINEAEDLLFQEIEQSLTKDNLKVALQFYKDLQDLSDDTLTKCDFSREEIAEGLESIRKLYN